MEKRRSRIFSSFLFENDNIRQELLLRDKLTKHARDTLKSFQKYVWCEQVISICFVWDSNVEYMQYLTNINTRKGLSEIICQKRQWLCMGNI